MPFSSDITTLSLDFHSLRQAYANGLTATALVQEVVRRINAKQNSYIWTHVVDLEDLLQRARDIDRIRTQSPTLPLLGLPYGVKDNIDVTGIPTTAGCNSFSYISERTATVVTKLHEAGGILIGKQNMDQFATGLVGIRSPHGYCRNPFDERYIPGGSSSGSAVAVSTGQVSFSIGSDTGGSGRVPAALNNIIGLKPTPGVASTYGFLYCNRSFDVAPIFALEADDAYDVLDTIKGYDERDIYSKVSVDASKDMAERLPSTFQFAVPSQKDLTFFGDDLAQAQFTNAVERLKVLGGVPIEIDFAAFLEAGTMVFNSPLIAERWLTYGDIAASNAEDVHPSVRQAILAAEKYSAADTFRVQYRLQELKKEVNRLLAKYAFLLVPTTGTVYRCDEVEANPIQLNSHLGYYTYFANPLGLCGISVPSGLRKDGLPTGVSLLSTAFNDYRLRPYAIALHASVGGYLGATTHGLNTRQKDAA